MPRVTGHAGRSRATRSWVAGSMVNHGGIGQCNGLAGVSRGRPSTAADGVLVEPAPCEQPGRAPDRRARRTAAAPNRLRDHLARSVRVALGSAPGRLAPAAASSTAVPLEVGPGAQMPVAAPPQLIAERDGERVVVDHPQPAPAARRPRPPRPASRPQPAIRRASSAVDRDRVASSRSARCSQSSASASRSTAARSSSVSSAPARSPCSPSRRGCSRIRSPSSKTSSASGERPPAERTSTICGTSTTRRSPALVGDRRRTRGSSSALAGRRIAAPRDDDLGHLRLDRVQDLAVTSGCSTRNALTLVRPWPSRSSPNEKYEPGLLDDLVLQRHVQHRALPRDALAVGDVELGLLERRRHLVLDDLHPHPVADRLGALLERLDAADVEPHRRVELERAAARASSPASRT